MTRRAESLAALQERFWRLISAPEPVARALPQVTATDPGAAPLSGWIRAASEGAAAARLDVYANMYFFRLLGVLRDDYPNLARLVGADAFHNLITDYLVAFPSRHPSIRHVGANLAELLDRHPLERRFPGAADLARLEWARGLAFDRADARALTADELTAVPPERWGELRFQLVPSFQMLRLGRPVHRLWQALERGEGGAAPAPAPAPASAASASAP
ncbi:MAG TPA: DNA-binding domain-containing protein, partial [Kofleriaceae bacterium]|nr:DNA-binding domain-containing protein [Kofleriaceae bacterium]